MYLCIVVFAFSISLTQAYTKYVIQAPEIIVYDPFGFSVSIPNEPGIRLFAFHGNINEELVSLQPGQFSKDVIRSTNNKWTFNDRRTKLKIGDVINYWLLVVKDGLGYRLDNGKFIVTELVHNPILQPHVQHQRPLHAHSAPTPNEQENEIVLDRDNTLCLQSVYNVTQTFIQLQAQYDQIKKKNNLMKELLEKTANAKQLTLSGRIPPDGQPIATVSFILREKLNLNPSISSANRNTDGSITFEVTSLDEKLKILYVSKEKLVLTKIFLQ